MMDTADKKSARYYKFLAFTTFNTIIFILVLNLILGLVFFVRDALKKPEAKINSYRLEFTDLDAYTRISKADADKFLDEQDHMWDIGFQYEPWVQFRHPEFQGTFLNTDSRGFRKTREPQKREGTPVKVYVLGGSTTFGYGVPDDYTIPSYMQTMLEQQYPNNPVVVKNFGQGYYYSTQELLLFISLIKDGDIPDSVIFIDGINDISNLARAHDKPWFTPTVKALWDAKRGVAPNPIGTRQGPSWIPMVRLADSLSARFFPEKEAKAKPQSNDAEWRDVSSDSDFTKEEIQNMADYVVTRYTGNMNIIRALCKEYGIKCYFVWQPHPGYKYDRQLHKKFPFNGPVPSYLGMAYARLENYKADDYLFLGSMLEKATSKVYVDHVHYNETVNETIAQEICALLKFDKKSSDKPELVTERLKP